jgi:hypothetical protein
MGRVGNYGRITIQTNRTTQNKKRLKKFSNRRKDRNGEGLPRHQTEMSRVKIRHLVSPCNSGFILFTTEISTNYNLILLLLDRSQRINVINAVIDATITNKMNIGPNA